MMVMKILTPYLTFSDTTSEGLLEHFITASQEWKSRFPTQTLLLWMGQAIVLFFGFVWSRLLIIQAFSSSRLPFPGTLARENRLLWVLFLSALFGFCRLPASSTPSLRYEQKEIPENSPSCCPSGPEVPAALPSSCCLSESSQSFSFSFSLSLTHTIYHLFIYLPVYRSNYLSFLELS